MKIRVSHRLKETEQHRRKTMRSVCAVKPECDLRGAQRIRKGRNCDTNGGIVERAAVLMSVLLPC